MSDVENNQALVDDSLVNCDKIGSEYYTLSTIFNATNIVHI